MKAFIDANVLISAAMRGGVPGSIVDAALNGAFTFVTSREVLETFEDKLRVKFGVEPAIAHEQRLILHELAEVIEPGRTQPVSRDPDDDRVLAAALEAEVDAIVTGDKDLLTLGSHRGIEILTPREFMDRLEA